MNVTAIVLEQLEWDGSLRSLVYSGRNGASFWIAEHGEYQEDRRTPFHFLDDRERRAFERDFGRVRPRSVGSLSRGDNGYHFATTWRGLQTDRSGLSVYALILPEDAAPTHVRFTDPRSSRPYSHRASFDPRTSRVVCYLECRSQHGSFDFDVEVSMERDRVLAQAHNESGSDTYVPDLENLEDMMRWGPNGVDPTTVHNYFMSAGSQVIAAGERSVVTVGDVTGPILTGDIHGSVGSIGDHSRGRVTEQVDSEIVRMFIENRTDLLRELQELQLRAVDDSVVASARRAELALEAQDNDGAAVRLKAMGLAGYRAARDLGINLLAALLAVSLGIGQ